MFKNIFTKTLYDKKVFTIGWSLGLAVMAAITVAFFPAIKDQMGTLFANMPKALEGITGTPEDYQTILGYIATGVFDLRVPMMAIIMAVILGLNLSVVEESTERLYQLLVLPIKRRSVVLQKWFALLAILATSHGVLLLGIVATVAVIGESMHIENVLAGTVMCFLLTAVVGSMALALGFALGRRSLATMVVSGYTFGAYVLTSFAQQIDWLKTLDYFSIFHYYKGSQVVKEGFVMGNVAVLLGTAVVAVAFGIAFFISRDIGRYNA